MNQPVYTTGETHPVTVRDFPDALMAQVKSYADVYREYTRHPEVKSAGPDGEPCGPQTVGLLQRREIDVAHIYHVGK